MDVLYNAKDTILLNSIELLSMKKEYLIVYVKSLLFDLYGINKRRQLRKSINEYSDTIRLENLYLEMIIDNIDYIDEEKVEHFMDMLDTVNRKTYDYYEKVLASIENSIFQENEVEAKLPYKDFKTITENVDYQLEVLNIFDVPKDIKIKQNSKEIHKILSKTKNKV